MDAFNTVWGILSPYYREISVVIGTIGSISALFCIIRWATSTEARVRARYIGLFFTVLGLIFLWFIMPAIAKAAVSLGDRYGLAEEALLLLLKGDIR